MPTTGDVEDVRSSLERIHREWNEATSGRLDPMDAEIKRVANELVALQGKFNGLLSMEAGKERQADGAAVVQSGMYAGLGMVEMEIARGIARAAYANQPTASTQKWVDAVEAAISTTEWASAIGTGVAMEMWEDIHLASMVANLFPPITMPRSPFELPTNNSETVFYPGTQSTAATQTDLSPTKSTLTAYELVGEVGWSYDVDEDSVVAMAPTVRAELVRDAARAMDDVIVNASTDVGSGNINSDGVALPGDDYRAKMGLGFNGLRNQLLVSQTAHGVATAQDAAASTVHELRTKLGKYGVNPADLALVVAPEVYLKLLTDAAVQTLDKYGVGATILTGELGRVYGVPIIVTDFLRANKADGKVSNTPGDNTRYTALLVNRMRWRRGTMRNLLIETYRNTQKREISMTASMRLAFTPREPAASADAVSGAYNLGV